MFVDMGNPQDQVLADHDELFAVWLGPKMASKEYIGFVAESEVGENIGGAGLWLPDWPPHPRRPDTRRGYVMNVYVQPEYRGQGIAKRLMIAVMDWCKEHNTMIISLHASDAGRPVYEGLGFEGTNEMRIELGK
jgi:GNAT superfamily N-acetyltransferase